MTTPQTSSSTPRMYDDDADALVSYENSTERVTLLPPEETRLEPGRRVRILWGQDMLRDVLDGRYRVVICGVNDTDNDHGIIAQIVNLVTTSQWSPQSLTSYARMFQGSVAEHAANDKEPYILKYDLDSLLIFGVLRPKGRDHFTLKDIEHAFRTVSKMIAGRQERRPVATVSFLGARSNRLVDEAGGEPSFESVLRAMHTAGFRGDVYPPPSLWGVGDTGLFPSYPFPEALDRMRGGSS